MTTKCLWIWFSTKCNSYVLAHVGIVFVSCAYFYSVVFVKFACQSAGSSWGGMSVFIARLVLLWSFFTTPKSGNIVPCHFEFFFALNIHNEQE